MTIVVKLSITIEAENGEGKKIEARISPETFDESLDDLGRQVIQAVGLTALSTFDSQLKQSQYRNSVTIRSSLRTYHFPKSSFSYRRHSYKLPDGSIHTPLDALLGFEKYQRRSWKSKEQECALAAELSYRKADHLNSYISQRPVSASTICRDIRQVGRRISEQEQRFEAEEAGQIEAPELYCESDGVWISLQKNKVKKAEIRFAIGYTGKKYISKDRRKLKNKYVLMAIGVPSSQWQNMIREKFYSHYDLENTKRVYVGGDGATWVGNSFELLGEMEKIRVLDPFHVKRAVGRAFADAVDVKPILNQLYEQGFAAVESQLLDVVAKGDKARVKARLSCLEYLRNHADEIIKAPSLGSVESNIDKYVVHRMKTRGVSWSLEGAQAMLSILQYKNELYEHSFPYKKNKDTKGRRGVGKADTGSVHKASFPVLNSGKMSVPYAKLFKNMINDDLPLSS